MHPFTTLPALPALATRTPRSVDGQPTTPSNADFHARLLERGPGWGYKDVGAVAAAGAAHGLALAERRPMPADNFTLILRKQ